MSIDLVEAKAVLLAEAKNADEGPINPKWQKAIEHFSDVCETSTLTHVAFLGTALLAKSVNIDTDVWAVKAGSRHPGAYSARSLCHGVIVPQAVRLGISLGVTGREPLNNQPYFQIQRLSRTTTVHANARPALQALCDLLDLAERLKSRAEVRAALRAFIFVRRQRNPSHGAFGLTTRHTSIDDLVDRIISFVAENSEGGKRAQGVAAGLLDAYAGPDRVLTSRVNDPSRHAPGDVCVLASANAHQRENVLGVRDEPLQRTGPYAIDQSRWEKVFEIRDKPMQESDLYAFAHKCVSVGAQDAGVLAVSANQKQIDMAEVTAWATQRGLALVVYLGWKPFVRQALFWAHAGAVTLARKAPQLIFDRLVELEVSGAGTKQWREMNS